MKTISTDLIVMIVLAILLLIAVQFEWIRTYYALSFVPLYGMYLVGKYVGGKAVGKESKNFRSKE